MAKLHIGFDDTDSPYRGCTTYIAALLVEKIGSIGVQFTDYPNLIRLNPNVPWKTRGNGALCLRFKCQEKNAPKIKEIVMDTIEANSELGYSGTDPGIAFVSGDVPQEIRLFAKKAEQSIMQIDEAVKLTKRTNTEALGFKKGRGLVGALAAIGEELKGDHTYEIISYRIGKNRGKPRQVDAKSVISMDKKSSLTFNNVDPKTGRVLITPRGADPILCGIRGETPEAVKQAQEMLVFKERVERWMIFRTNQGTDAHLRRVTTVKQIQPYNPVVAKGTVSKLPKVIQGGHAIFSIEDETGEVDCAAYKPTATLCQTARKLLKGDVVQVFGGVSSSSSKHNLTINLEKMKILTLVPKILTVNPRCPKCDKRMKSMGRKQGFRCHRCGFRSSKQKKQQVEQERELKTGLYITSPRSQRHLTKPHCRYGKEKWGTPKELTKEWHYP